MQQLKNTLEGMAKAFEDFKTTKNSEMARLRERLDKFEIAQNRKMAPGGGGRQDGVSAEQREAFNSWVRYGDDSQLRAIQNAMKTFIGSDGGFAVPSVINDEIIRVAGQSVVMRQLANVLQVDTPEFKTLVNVAGTSSGWVGETEARPATDTPSLKELTPYWGEVYAMPEITQILLEDAGFAVEPWIIGEIATQFAEEEGEAFVSGDGIKKPKGFLSYDTAATADGTRAFGTLRYYPSGVADALPADPDTFVDMLHGLKPKYRQNAVWLMNSATLATIRKYKDGEGRYLWADSLVAGQPPTFIGYPVFTDDYMPDAAANVYPVAFGNFRQGYLITDRVTMMTLRDPFTNKPYVRFYSRKRTGGFVANSEAIRLLKCAVA